MNRSLGGCEEAACAQAVEHLGFDEDGDEVFDGCGAAVLGEDGGEGVVDFSFAELWGPGLDEVVADVAKYALLDGVELNLHDYAPC